MTAPIDAMPPLPAVSFLGDDISYGYDREDMHAYAQAYAAQQCAELEAKLAAAFTALQSCSEGGYCDIDGDFIERLWYDKELIANAFKALTPKETP